MVKHCGTRGCEHFKNMRWPLVQTYGLELTSETRSSIHAAKMSSHTESRGQVVSLSSGSRYSISAMLAPAFGPPLPPVSLPRAAVRGGAPTPRATRTARARACSPSPWGDVGYLRISVYGARCQARREVIYKY